MQKQMQHTVGIVLIGIGTLFILSNLLNVSAWSILWPIFLIAVGIWLIFRQRHLDESISVEHHLLGDILKEGRWRVNSEEIRIGIGDIKLDFTQADIPSGQTTIQIFGLIADVHVAVNKQTGIRIETSGIITEVNALGIKKDKFFSSHSDESANFTKSRKKILLKTNCLIQEIKLKQV